MAEPSWPTQLGLRFDPAELAGVFDPFVIRRFASDGAEWIGELEVRRRKYRRMLEKSLRAGPPPKYPDQAFPADRDERHAWALEWYHRVYGVPGDPVLVQWDRAGFLVKGVATARVHLLLMVRVVEALGPRSVLEVGCGEGANLFVLAELHPGARFHGTTLTPNSLARANVIRRLPRLPDSILAFSPVPLEPAGRHAGVVLSRGNARRLPYPDGAFDLVFTRLALEQMEEIREEALAEIARVSRGHVLMVEPFRDWNAGDLRKDYVEARRYFNAAVGDLERHGLVPVHVFDDFPYKVNLRAGLVVARKRGAGSPPPQAPVSTSR